MKGGRQRGREGVILEREGEGDEMDRMRHQRRASNIAPAQLDMKWRHVLL